MLVGIGRYLPLYYFLCIEEKYLICCGIIHHCLSDAQSHSRSPACSTAVFSPPPLIFLSLFSICFELSCSTLPFSFPRMHLIHRNSWYLQKGREEIVEKCRTTAAFCMTLFTPFPSPSSSSLCSPSPLPLSHGVETTLTSSLFFWMYVFSISGQPQYFKKSLGVKRKRRL